MTQQGRCPGFAEPSRSLRRDFAEPSQGLRKGFAEASQGFAITGTPDWRRYSRMSVPGVGIEPTWPRGRKILSLLRLPGFATRAHARPRSAGRNRVKRTKMDEPASV